MFKFVVLFALFACAMASPKPGLLGAAEIVAPVVAAAPVATSYQNTYKVSVKSPVYAAAPIVAAAPAIAYSVPVVKAPVVTYAAHPAPIYKAAPLVAAAPVW